MSKDFVFDSTTGNFVPSPKTMEEIDESAPQSADDPVDTEFVPLQEDDEAFSYNPGGDSAEALRPPETFYVLDQTIRTAPDGSTVVDVVIEVEDGSNSTEYEVRVTK